MALETLKGVKEIGGFEVYRKADGGSNAPIIILDDCDSIAFRIQNGPIEENGANGCQVDTLIETARIMLAGLDKKFPCEHNKMAYNSLCTALWHLNKRREDREKRGVEGTYQL